MPQALGTVAADAVVIPTVSEAAALAGSSGSPGGGNRYVTENDPRITALAGSSNVVYVATIGTGAATTFAINHNLGTRSLHIQVRQSNSPFAVVEPNIELTTINQATISFEGYTPATNEFTVTILAAGSAGTLQPFVTALPAGPIDGQEVDYLVTTAPGGTVVWHLKYRSSDSRWYKIGGPPLLNRYTSIANYPGWGYNSGGTTNTDPTITVPLAGRYEAQWSTLMYQDAVSGTGTRFASVIQTYGSIESLEDDIGNQQYHQLQGRDWLDLAAGNVVRFTYAVNGPVGGWCYLNKGHEVLHVDPLYVTG
jgi:hypothetical protein